MPETTEPEPGAEPPERHPRWAEHALGDLVARAWPDPVESPATAPATPDVVPPQTSGWEVERLPSEEEGGIVRLLLGTREAPTEAPTDGPAWPERVSQVKVTGLARLTEMLDQLPTEPTPRVTAADMAVDAPSLAPPAVWFWGDDDIYPGKLPGVPDGARGRITPARRKGSWRLQVRTKRRAGGG